MTRSQQMDRHMHGCRIGARRLRKWLPRGQCHRCYDLIGNCQDEGSRPHSSLVSVTGVQRVVEVQHRAQRFLYVLAMDRPGCAQVGCQPEANCMGRQSRVSTSLPGSETAAAECTECIMGLQLLTQPAAGNWPG
jgi:hypothetical protein